MKLFGRKQPKEEPKQAAQANPECLHPLTHRVALREDPSAPGRVTGVKCTLCGRTLSPGGVPV